MKRALILSTLLAWAGVALNAVAVVGQPAPGFTATDITGKTVSLSDYKGKIVVLESYNSDCPYCANHYKTGAMQELQKDLTNQGVIFLLVNSVNASNPSHRTAEAAQKEWAAEKINATAWIDDSSGAVGKLYGMRTTPHMFVIDKDGVLAYQGAIDDQPATSGDPRKAHNYVRAAVKQLQSGQKVAIPETKPYGCSVKYGT